MLIRPGCEVVCEMQSSVIQTQNFHPLVSPKDDLFICLRPLLIFGRFIGIIPFEGVYRTNPHALKYKSKHYAAVKTTCVIIILVINVTMALLGMVRVDKKNANDLARSASPSVFFSMGLFLYCYFLSRSEILINIFIKWTKISLQFSKEDTHLFRDVNVIATFVFTSGILENACLHLLYFPICGNGNNPSDANLPVNPSALQIYYHRSHPFWAEIIPYDASWAILVFVSNKLALYAWNFSDILVAVMSRAIYFKFKSLIESAEEQLLTENSCIVFPSEGNELWKQLTRDHSSICVLLSEFEKFLSPIIFASYAVNIYFLCLQLHLGLSPSENSSFAESFYAVWSFLHLITRIFIVSLSAARINEYAHKLRNVFQKCPLEFYSTEVRLVERCERSLYSGGEIGLTGLGCFVITKPFILKILSVTFTFEIVLLQASSPLTDINCISSHTNSISNNISSY